MGVSEQVYEAHWRFGITMQRMLERNLHKQRDGKPLWKSLSVAELLNILRRDVQELELAWTSAADADEVEEKAADVANLAMMVADRYADGGSEGTEEEQLRLALERICERTDGRNPHSPDYDIHWVARRALGKGVLA